MFNVDIIIIVVISVGVFFYTACVFLYIYASWFASLFSHALDIFAVLYLPQLSESKKNKTHAAATATTAAVIVVATTRKTEAK